MACREMSSPSAGLPLAGERMASFHLPMECSRLAAVRLHRPDKAMSPVMAEVLALRTVAAQAQALMDSFQEVAQELAARRSWHQSLGLRCRQAELRHLPAELHPSERRSSSLVTAECLAGSRMAAREVAACHLAACTFRRHRPVHLERREVHRQLPAEPRHAIQIVALQFGMGPLAHSPEEGLERIEIVLHHLHIGRTLACLPGRVILYLSVL